MRCVKRAGLDPTQVVRHTLRHTAITHLVQAGVDLPTVKGSAATRRWPWSSGMPTSRDRILPLRWTSWTSASGAMAITDDPDREFLPRLHVNYTVLRGRD